MPEDAAEASAILLPVEETLEREFEARLRETSTLAFRVAFAVLRQREDAEDVAQEAFARAYRNFHQLRDQDRFRAWLVRMTWRLAINQRRSNRRRESREAVHADVMPELTAADALVERERVEQLWSAIDALPEKLRLTLVLAGIQEHDVAAVAAVLDVPAGTVKSRLFAARRRLKELLQCMNAHPTAG